nr:VWA domain-containing protein [Bacillus benzoevorans]
MKQAISIKKWTAEVKFTALLRGLLFLVLVFALTVPQILFPAKEDHVIFLVDRSASVQGSEAKILDWIEKSASEKDIEDTYAVAAFGKDTAIERSLKKTNEPLSDFHTETEQSETNIEEALTFASALIPNDSGGRIVLFTDGNETAGSANEAIEILKSRHIQLDTVVVEQVHADDLSLEELTVPPVLFAGEKTRLALTINSTSAKKAAVRISVNNREILKKTINVKEGRNEFDFLHHVEESGLLIYKAEIIPEEDRFLENNVLYSVANVKGTPKILTVEVDNSGSIVPILQQSGFAVEQRGPEQLPTTLSGYLAYQSIIFNNVPATVIKETQMNLIEQAVKEFGTGFIMAGGEESFGLGGYFKTPIEKLLPVDMDIKGKNEMPSLGLILVMDRSGSMAGNKLALAKEAAARSVSLLREEDTLGFIAFDSGPWKVVETAPLKDKDEVIDKIQKVSPGGGTEIYSSLELAYEELKDLKLQRKHIILLTDGQSALNHNYDLLTEEGKTENITLSTVALGGDADHALLEQLAENGGGRYYDVTDSSVIPSILSRETVMASRTYIEDHPFYPGIQTSTDWRMFQEGVPQMNAYIATTAKPRAAVPVLSEKKDPVLAEWQYGMGYTMAFTSDFSGKWSGDWAAWSKWPQFINQMITKSLPKYDSSPYDISLHKEDGNTVLVIKSAGGSTLPLDVSLVTDKGKRLETNTKITGPGTYETDIPDNAGMYFLSVNETTETGDVNNYQTGFTVPYSSEYLTTGHDEKRIAELADRGKGKVLQQEKDAFRPLPYSSYHKQSLSQWLILAAFLLFFSEIALRRFGLKRLAHWTRLDIRNKIRNEHSDTTLEKIVKVEKLKTRAKNKLVVQRKITQENKPETEEKMNRTKVDKMKQSNGEGNITEAEKEERMRRLLEAKNRKNK